MNESTLALIFNSNRTKVLSIKRRDVPIWVLPGGGLDDGEDPVKGVIREVLEETGLNTKSVRKVAIYSPINKLSSKTHLFECTVEPGHLKTGDETADIGFADLNNLPYPFFFIHEDMIKDAQVIKNITQHKKHEKVTYKALIYYLIRHPILVFRFFLSKIGFPINKKTLINR